jgi:hypothetical protein
MADAQPEPPAVETEYWRMMGYVCGTLASPTIPNFYETFSITKVSRKGKKVL